jgi:hypothetical protein
VIGDGFLELDPRLGETGHVHGKHERLHKHSIYSAKTFGEKVGGDGESGVRYDFPAECGRHNARGIRKVVSDPTFEPAVVVARAMPGFVEFRQSAASGLPSIAPSAMINP